MYSARVEHFDIEGLRDRYHWHLVHLLLFIGFTFIFSVTELNFSPTAFSTSSTAPRFSVKTAESSGAGILRPVVKTLQAYQPSQMVQNYKMIEGNGTVEVHFSTAMLFAAGQGDFVAGGVDEVRRFGRAFATHKGDVLLRIEGHTDDVPVVKMAWKYPTNWELSSARAARIAKALTDVGFAAHQIEVVGRADAEPLVSNRSPAGEAIERNQLANRRVVIKLSPAGQ